MGQCLTYFFPSGETTTQNSNNWANKRPRKPENLGKNRDLSHFAVTNLPRIEQRKSLTSVASQQLQIIDIEDLSDIEDLQAEQTNVEVNRRLSLGEGGRVLTACNKSQREQELQNQIQDEKDTANEAKLNMAEKMSIRFLASSFTSTSASDSDFTDDEDGVTNKITGPFPRPSPWRKLYLKAIKPKEVAATTKKELQLLQKRPSSRVDWLLLKRRFNRRPGLWRLRKNRRIVPARQELDSSEQGRGKTIKTHLAKARDNRVEDDHTEVVGGILLLQGIDETSRVYRVAVKNTGEDEGYFASGEED